MQTIRTNLKINASTQYTNYNFTSMCICNGKVLGAGPGGLFRLCCSDNDGGVQIDAYFIPYTIDFGNDFSKRLRRVYVGGKFENTFSLTITGNGGTINGPYEITNNISEGEQVQMFPIDRGSGYKFVYASFKFENVDGSFFAIDSADAIYTIQARRRRY